jgi:hypothetical protein
MYLGEMGMAVYLNSYRPLVITAFGVAAAARHKIPPFVDGSIRREPDLAHEFPSISCVCRGDKFAPRLAVGDIVGYMTVKHRFGDRGKSHRRLTAILEVIQRFESHEAAAQWYRVQGKPLPSNCLVDGNPPLDMEFSHKDPCDPDYRGVNDPQQCWDDKYWLRTTENGTFLVCKALYRELGWLSPQLADEDLVAAFGRVPPSRNPGEISRDSFNKLLALLRVPVQLSGQ